MSGNSNSNGIPKYELEDGQSCYPADHQWLTGRSAARTCSQHHLHSPAHTASPSTGYSSVGQFSAQQHSPHTGTCTPSSQRCQCDSSRQADYPKNTHSSQQRYPPSVTSRRIDYPGNMFWNGVIPPHQMPQHASLPRHHQRLEAGPERREVRCPPPADPWIAAMTAAEVQCKGCLRVYPVDPYNPGWWDMHKSQCSRRLAEEQKQRMPPVQAQRAPHEQGSKLQPTNGWGAKKLDVTEKPSKLAALYWAAAVVEDAPPEDLKRMYRDMNLTSL